MVQTLPEIWEFILAPAYIAIGFLFSFTVKDLALRRIFTYTLAARIAGGLIFLVIYLFYYGGGDTIAYFQSAVPVINLFFQDPILAFRFMLEPYSLELYFNFNTSTGYPLGYIVSEVDTLSMTKSLIPVAFLGLKSYLLTTILMAIISLIGPWRFFLSLQEIAPNSRRLTAIAILFFPSVLFWGCGISKDTFTFSATCLLVHVLYEQIIMRRFNLTYALAGTIAFIMVLYIKPYIILVLLPGASLWYFFKSIQSIRNRFVRLSLAPFILSISSLALIGVLTQFGDALGEYSFDRILDKAIITQQDLKQEYYGGNSFDIGTIEATWTGVLAKFPIATFYGFYGPTILQARNAVSAIAAIENTFLLLVSVYLIFYQNPIKTINYIFSHPFLVFCISFSIMFAFSIGLTTANFGALVRFKIPLIPFFVCFLLLMAFKRKLAD